MTGTEGGTGSQVLGGMQLIFSGVAIVTDLDRGQKPPVGILSPDPPPAPAGGVTGTGGVTGPQVLGGFPGALN